MEDGNCLITKHIERELILRKINAAIYDISALRRKVLPPSKTMQDISKVKQAKVIAYTDSILVLNKLSQDIEHLP